MKICSSFLFFHHYVLTKFSPCCCLNFLAHKKAKNSLKKIRENVGNIFFFIFCISRLKTRTVALKSCGSFAISCQKFLATTWTTKAKPKMKIMVSWIVEFSVWGILIINHVGSLQYSILINFGLRPGICVKCFLSVTRENWDNPV